MSLKGRLPETDPFLINRNESNMMDEEMQGVNLDSPLGIHFSDFDNVIKSIPCSEMNTEVLGGKEACIWNS